MFRSRIGGARMTMVLLLGFTTGSLQAQELDLVISGGRVVDGTGAPWYEADIGVRNGKIVRIGRIRPESARRVLDAKGLIVAPGFVDMMGQTATPLMEDPKTAFNLLSQGITTINAGEGSSAAPLSPTAGGRKGWTTMAEYFALLEMSGLPINVAQTVGHAQIRRIVLGNGDRQPTPGELDQMRALVSESMNAGAIGVSTALIYPPGVFADTDELVALAEVAGRFGGGYYTHLRNEGDRLLEAVDEALEIGRRGKTPVHIFHLKAAGRQNWGKMQLAIAKIKEARASGRQVAADIYPYINNGLGISSLIHPRHFAEGHDALIDRLSDATLRATIRREMESEEGWENWYRHAGKDWNRIIIGHSNTARYKALDGHSIADIAASQKEDPWDTFFSLVRAGAFALPETMTDANKILALKQEFTSFCTDVGPAAGGRSASHPRAYGSLPRLLSRYVRDLGAISLERAVAQAAAVATNEIQAYDRGRISVGLAADLIAFDYAKLEDRATFASPDTPSIGVRYVVINGQLVLDDGKMTSALPGIVLRGPGYDPSTASHNITLPDPDQNAAGVDRLMRDFIEEHHVPGASVALTHGGRLDVARCFGYANVAARKAVQPSSLFRIASISKPITAVAVLQLVEQNKLDLDGRLLEVLDYDKEIAAVGETFDARLRDVTIRHLLQHRGGWDRDKSFDPMFQSVRFARQCSVDAPADQAAVIRAMLSQPLDFEPGERYAYSNFGYCLLGRVIEHVSGESYESFVRRHVLAPLGITDMVVGATLLAKRSNNEVRYYHPTSGTSVFQADLDQEVPWPYGAFYLEAMDSHGAWLASATDLARFAMAFDDPDHCKILSRKSIEWMYERPPGLAGHDAQGKPKDVYYSLGWLNRDVGKGRINHWHTGSLPGTAAILIRRWDGCNMVALLNTRVSPTSQHLGQSIDSILHQAADQRIGQRRAKVGLPGLKDQ